MRTDVARLYPNILHNSGLKALNNMLETREYKGLSIQDLVKMGRFVLEHNYFKFNGDVKKKFLGTAIGTNLHCVTHVYLWINLKTNFYNLEHCNL